MSFDFAKTVDQLVEELGQLQPNDKPRFNGKQFVPAGRYKEVLGSDSDPDLVPRILGVDKQHHLVDFVLNSAPKVFILSLQAVGPRTPEETQTCIQHSYDLQFTDRDLPAREESCRECSRESGCPWTARSRKNLYFSQWVHLAPIFNTRANLDDFTIRLKDEQPLPISKSECTAQGASSVVHRVEVHPDHLIDPDGEIPITTDNWKDVALKELRPQTDATETSDFSSQFDRESRALKEIRDLKDNHIIQWIATITSNSKNYLMFPWADGGNLHTLWEEVNPLEQNAAVMRTLVHETLEQFRGLANALYRLHVTKKYRHGDVKPENILRFRDKSENSERLTGTLKIADFGLAKQHNRSTYGRGPTATRQTTIQYESPEALAAIQKKKAISRLTDIWSLGCVMLEHLIWLVYGYEKGVQEFNRQLVKNERQPDVEYHAAPFYEKTSEEEIKVRQTVRKWIQSLNVHEDLGNTVIYDLVKLVEKNLLVTTPRLRWDTHAEDTETENAGPIRTEPSSPGATGRATAREVRDRLDELMAKSRTHETKENAFLFPEICRRDLAESMMLSRRVKDPLSTQKATLSVPEPGTEKIGSIPKPGKDYDQRMKRRWSFRYESELSPLEDHVMYPPSLPKPADLCQRCRELKFDTVGFTMNYPTSDMEGPATECDLCQMLSRIRRKRYGDKAERRAGVLERYNYTLRDQDDSDNEPLLSIIDPKSTRPLQCGFPQLPNVGSETHLKILSEWLANCDRIHPCCSGKGQPETSIWTLPTRLLDVGDTQSPNIVLIETKHEDNAKIISSSNTPGSPYIALSHPWGPEPHFCTFPDNHRQQHETTTTLSSHKNGIPISKLPKTFQDAVTVTRALGKRYLWIDSLCILQGPDGDFKEEAQRMETVFHEAYVVIAATAATSQNDGFLHPETSRDRQVVAIGRGQDPPLYVCEMIDSFEKDVINGHLNTRAWVLQERALAKRTIYFTHRQTYFECGNSVRCETGARMVNDPSKFLGDPSFPEVLLSGNRGEQIERYQELYKQYSRLNLSHEGDRPIAIRGLESRLVAAFAMKYPEKGITGAYGVLIDGPRGGLLHRSLLWRRSFDGGGSTVNIGNATTASKGTSINTTTMTRSSSQGGGRGHPRAVALRQIDFPSTHKDKPPSWSWMAYSGGIDFVPVPGDTVEWEHLELYPNISKPERPMNTAKTIIAQACKFPTAIALSGEESSIPRITYDDPGMSLAAGEALKCVIVGREKITPEMDPLINLGRGNGIGSTRRDSSSASTSSNSSSTKRSVKRHVKFSEEIISKEKERVIFVLVVAETHQTGSFGKLKNLKLYKRAGAGSMKGAWIRDLESGGETIAIV